MRPLFSPDKVIEPSQSLPKSLETHIHQKYRSRQEIDQVRDDSQCHYTKNNKYQDTDNPVYPNLHMDTPPMDDTFS